jgi:hypothetical protein
MTPTRSGPANCIPRTSRVVRGVKQVLPRRSQLSAIMWVMEEELAYQVSLASDGSGDALAAEALAVLVNQRLRREGNVARCNSADVRGALVVAASPVLGGVTEREFVLRACSIRSLKLSRTSMRATSARYANRRESEPVECQSCSSSATLFRARPRPVRNQLERQHRTHAGSRSRRSLTLR